MGKIAFSVVLIVAALSLVGCAAFPWMTSGGSHATAPAPVVTGAATTPQATPAAPLTGGCVNGVATYNSPGATASLSSDCGTVEISGSNITLSAAGITTLVIAGDHDRVTAKSIGVASISGSSDGITATTIGSLNISGNQAAIAGYTSIGAVVVQGNDNTVTSPSIPSIEQSGQNNRIGKI